MEKPETDFEVIIVDDSSDPDDNFEKFVRMGIERINPWFNVRAFKMPLSCSKMNWGRTLNVGVKQSKGDIIIINHSDCIHLAKETLTEIERFHANVEPSDLYLLLARFVNTKPDHFGKIHNLDNPAGSSMPRKLYDELGGFDETFDGYGHLDADFYWRLHYGRKDNPHWKEARSETLFVQHQSICAIGLKRSIYPNPHNEERVDYNMEFNNWTVNPDGWGECKELEELDL